MDQREPDASVGGGPAANSTSHARDQELTYDSGGLSFGLSGVILLCVLVACGGLVLGLRMPTILVVILTIGVPGMAWIYFRLGMGYPRQRAEQMRQAAEGLGLAYQADVPPQQLEELSRIPILAAGRFPRGCNFLSGNYRGIPVSLLDYHYKVGSGGKLHGRWVTVVLLPEVAGSPEFQLVPGGLMHRWVASLGASRVHFSEDAIGSRFSQHYVLHGTPEAAVRAVFTRPVVEYLAEHPGWTVVCSRGLLALWRAGPTQAESNASFKLTSQVDPGFRSITPAVIPDLVAQAVALRQRFHTSESR
jgi:hypothetical protein